MAFRKNELHRDIILVQIDGKTYELDAFFSFSDSERSLAIEGEASSDYCEVLAEIVQGHIIGKKLPPLEQIKDSGAISLYINSILDEDDELREKYELHSEVKDQSERFIKAANEITKEELNRFREILKTTVLPRIENVVYNPVYSTARIISESLGNITKSILKVSTITESYQNVFRVIEAQQSFFKDLSDQIIKTIPKMPAFSISEKRMKEIVEAQRIWGGYGWTIPRHGMISDFLNAPINKNQADQTAMKYCTKIHMEALFDETKELKRINKHDYEEAVANYKDRRYKSCALLLFSLIDAQLIRMQRNNGNKWRETGKNAAKLILDRYKEEQLVESMYFSVFRYENLYACLMKVFEKGDNFKKQPEIINRNFLDHGMLTVRVRKRDCIQLFLLYYNGLIFLERLN